MYIHIYNNTFNMFRCSLCMLYLIIVVYIGRADKVYSDLSLIQNTLNTNYNEISVVINEN